MKGAKMKLQVGKFSFKFGGLACIAMCALIIYDGLRYLQQDASGWSETGVISGTFQYAALALDDGGYAHASYYDVNAGALRYSYQDASGWHSEKIDDEGDPGKYTDITIDALGYPHISYHDNAYPGTGNLKYASLDDQGWHVQTVDTTYNTGFSTSIVLDASGKPYISYHNDSTQDLLLAYPLTEAVYLPVVLNN